MLSTGRASNSPKLSGLHFFGSLLVEPEQVRLPTNGNTAGEDIPKLRRDVDEAECSNRGPQLNAVGNADRKRLLETLNCLFQGGPGQESVKTEEVCVKHRGEAHLLHDDLGQDRQELG